MNRVSKKEIKRAANNMMEYFDLTPKKVIRKIAIEVLIGKVNAKPKDVVNIGKIPYNILFNDTSITNNCSNRLLVDEFLDEYLFSQRINDKIGNEYAIKFMTSGTEGEHGDVKFKMYIWRKQS